MMQIFPAEEPHHLFDLLLPIKWRRVGWSVVGRFLLIPEAQGEDYEEQDFANRMKKEKGSANEVSNRFFFAYYVETFSPNA